MITLLIILLVITKFTFLEIQFERYRQWVNFWGFTHWLNVFCLTTLTGVSTYIATTQHYSTLCSLIFGVVDSVIVLIIFSGFWYKYRQRIFHQQDTTLTYFGRMLHLYVCCIVGGVSVMPVLVQYLYLDPV